MAAIEDAPFVDFAKSITHLPEELKNDYLAKVNISPEELNSYIQDKFAQPIEEENDSEDAVIAEDLTDMPMVVVAPQPVLAAAGTQTIIPQPLAERKGAPTLELSAAPILRSGFRIPASERIEPTQSPEVSGFTPTAKSVNQAGKKIEMPLSAADNNKAADRAELNQRITTASDRTTEKMIEQVKRTAPQSQEARFG